MIPALYACAGDARIAAVVADDGGVVVTVLGANERVHIVGWSPHPISVHASAHAAGTAGVASTHDGTSGIWEIAVDVGPRGWAKVRVGAVKGAT